LFIGPIYGDYQNWGYELGFDCFLLLDCL